MLAYQRALKDDPFNPSLLNKMELARERTSAQYEERGRALLKEGHVDAALEAFKRALTLTPSHPGRQQALTDGLRMKEARDLMQEADKLARLGRSDEALEAYAHATELDPGVGRATEEISRLSEKQEASRRDSPMGRPVTLKFKNAGLKEVLESIARINGMNVMFDKDVRNDPVTVAIEDTPFDEALELILSSNSLFSRQVGPQMLLISPNTKQKQEQYQDLMIRTFYLSNSKAKDMLALLKSMLDTKRVHANEQPNTIVIRDTPEKVELAERIILANDREEAEVVFDLEVLEVDRTKNLNYGLTYPKQAGVGIVPPGFTGTLAGDLAQQFTYRQLTGLGKDNFLFQLPTNVVIDFLKSVTDVKTLASPKLRVVNNRKGEVNIGDKQPILLSTTNVLPGQAATGAVPTTSTVTSVEFRDTGVKVTVEPSIRMTNELALKLKIEVIRLGEKVLLQASPPIEQFRFGNRTAETTLSMKDGETIVLAGLIQEDDRKTRVSVPWLGDIPVIGDWFSSFQIQRITTEVVLTITPHIMQHRRAPRPEAQVLWSGTDGQYATKPLFTVPVRHSSASLGLRPEGAIRTPAAESGAVRSHPAVGAAGLRAEVMEVRPLEWHPGDLAVRVGQEIRLALSAQHGHDLKTGSMGLRYDPAVLEFRQIDAGGGLRRAGGSVSVKQKESDAGTIEFAVTSSEGGPTVSGELLIATFLAKAPGVAQVYAGELGPTEGRQAEDRSPRPAVVRVR